MLQRYEEEKRRLLEEKERQRNDIEKLKKESKN
jgi:hypothetical protein